MFDVRDSNVDWITRMAALTGSRVKRMFGDDDDPVVDLMMGFFILSVVVILGMLAYSVLT